MPLGEAVADWNVVATVRDGAYAEARRALAELGPVQRTDYFNVLVLEVADVRAFAEALAGFWAADPDLGAVLGRVTPLERLFEFQSPAEFEARARAAATPWLDRLAGSRFHVRMHRRGFKGRLSSQDEERFLDRWVLASLGDGDRAAVDFDDPDWILDLETVGQRGGMSLWSRADLGRFPFLHLD